MARSATDKGPETKKRTTSSKRTSKGNRTSGKRTSTKRGNAKKDEDRPLSSDLRYELVVLLFAAFSLLLIISVYFNIGGTVGESVRFMMFGLFGVSAYILPVYILASSFFKIFNRGNLRLNNKLSLIFFGIVLVAMVAHIIMISDAQIHKSLSDERTFFATNAVYFMVSAQSRMAGGMVGGVMGDFFVILIGRVGSFIILGLMALSLIILITEQSLARVGRFIGTGFLWLGQRIQTGFKALTESVGKTLEEARQRRETEEAEQMGAAESMVTQEAETVKKAKKPPKSHDDEIRLRPSFLDRVRLSLEEGLDDGEDEAVAPVSKEPEKKEKKSKGRGYKVHGIDPFQKIIEQEEKERAFADQYKEEPKKVQPKPSFVSEADPIVEEKPEKVTPVPVEAIQTEIETGATEIVYRLPPMELMKAPKGGDGHVSMDDIDKKADKLIQTLESFGVGAKLLDVSVGPTVTRYELQPDVGVKVSKIVNLQDDIALNLASSGIRIEAPIPGKSAVGIEVPNTETKSVLLREVIDTNDFKKFPSKIAFALGKDIGGKTMIADIARMPHLLIAGATGSGKSVCVNTLITSILYTAKPDEVKLLMIDPKVVELSAYNGIPHLLIPVVTDPKKAAGALNWAVQEMNDRYKLFAAANVRDLKGYNNAVEENKEGKKLPQIVIIVDELADLMMAAPNDVEDAICRLAQMARAAGLHLIIATQRPSVDVITGLIKANIPSRIAFNVSSGVDSRTIIDTVGAEKLLGKGDMLFYPVGLQKPVRVQGAFISDKEVENIVTFLKDQSKANYNETIISHISKTDSGGATAGGGGSDLDSHFNEALELVIERQKASASMIQRYFRVGYNRAARIVDQLHDAGFVGEEEGSKPRKVLLTKEAFEAMKAEAENKEEGQSAAD